MPAARVAADEASASAGEGHVDEPALVGEGGGSAPGVAVQQHVVALDEDGAVGGRHGDGAGHGVGDGVVEGGGQHDGGGVVVVGGAEGAQQGQEGRGVEGEGGAAAGVGGGGVGHHGHGDGDGGVGGVGGGRVLGPVAPVEARGHGFGEGCLA